MLNDREKLVLHFVCMVTIAKITGMPNQKNTIETMVKHIRKNRCRSLNDEEIAYLLEDINDEMMAGKTMFQYLIDETVKTTGLEYGEDLR